MPMHNTLGINAQLLSALHTPAITGEHKSHYYVMAE